jgi:hypothetical protein
MVRAILASLSLVLLAGCAQDAAPVDGMEGPAPSLFEPTVLEFADSGSILLGNDSFGNTDSGCGNLDVDLDTARHVWTVPADQAGRPVSASDLTVTLTLVDAALLDADLYVEGPGGGELGRSTEFNVLTGPRESVTVPGPLAAGDYTIVVRGCTGSGAYEVAGSVLLA